MSLDELDLIIIKELEENARQPLHALARKLGLKRSTVRYRLNRLRSERILSTVCTGDLELLGYQYPLLIGINVSLGKVGTVANQMAQLPNIAVVCLTMGRYDIVAWALLRDRSAIAHLMSESLAGISDYITGIETIHSYQWVKDPWGYSDSKMENSSRGLEDELSDSDLSIIRAMQLDPMQTITKLARTVGCSRSVANARLQKLLKDGVIRFVSIVHPRALGYTMGVVILIKCKPDKVRAVANHLSAQDLVKYVSLITGRWQIFCGIAFRDDRHLYSFLSETLTLIPGIIEYELVHLAETLEYSTDFTGLAVVQSHSTGRYPLQTSS